MLDPAIIHVQRAVNEAHRRDPSFTCAAYALEKAHALQEQGYAVRLVYVSGLAEPHAVVAVQDPHSGEWLLDNRLPWPERRADLERMGYRFQP